MTPETLLFMQQASHHTIATNCLICVNATVALYRQNSLEYHIPCYKLRTRMCTCCLFAVYAINSIIMYGSV